MYDRRSQLSSVAGFDVFASKSSHLTRNALPTCTACTQSRVDMSMFTNLWPCLCLYACVLQKHTLGAQKYSVYFSYEMLTDCKESSEYIHRNSLFC